MPYRPIQHQIAAQAVASVSEVWARAGAAVEEVRQDYGEDLLVQTCLNGKMDAARLWVQVKGVQAAPEMKRRDGKAAIRVRADLALRWARTADVLLLILWDVQNDIGWYSIPDFSQLHSKLASKDREHISFEITSADIFDLRAAELISWHARLEHLSGFIRNWRRWQEEVEVIEKHHSTWVDEAVNEAIIDMMADLNMLDIVGKERTVFVNAAFQDLLCAGIKASEISNDPDSSEVNDFLGQIIIQALLKQIQYATGGLPSTTALLEEMTRVVYVVMNMSALVDSFRRES
jgi:hypothetical protein